MLPEKDHVDKKAPASGGTRATRDTIEEARSYLRSLIMELTDEECEMIWEKWSATHV